MENILNIKTGQIPPVKSPQQLRDEFEELIEAYKVSNPEKYAKKEPALLAKLAKLEAICSKKVEPEVKVKKPKAKQLINQK